MFMNKVYRLRPLIIFFKLINKQRRSQQQKNCNMKLLANQISFKMKNLNNQKSLN